MLGLVVFEGRIDTYNSCYSLIIHIFLKQSYQTHITIHKYIHTQAYQPVKVEIHLDWFFFAQYMIVAV